MQLALQFIAQQLSQMDPKKGDEHDVHHVSLVNKTGKSGKITQLCHVHSKAHLVFLLSQLVA